MAEQIMRKMRKKIKTRGITTARKLTTINGDEDPLRREN